MTSTGYDFVIAHEQVATEDLFPDKTHDAAARTVVRLIESSNAGLTIGLEGGWGSGKSTVVNFVKEKLINNKNESTVFFIFDTWAHRGDPLRRIFLESLIDEVDANQNNLTLQSLKRSISGRKKSVVVNARKSTSKLGGLLSISVLPVPFGAALLSTIKPESLVLPWNSYAGGPHLWFIFGLIFSLMPLIFLLGWRGFSEDEIATNHNVKNRLWTYLLGKKHWDVFESESAERYTQDITEDGERTSVEFESYFKKIIVSILETNKKKSRVVIVVDNLDRVDPEDAQSIWSILQTFFQHRSHEKVNENFDWQSKLWFLIPYDRDGLSRIWEDRLIAQHETKECAQTSPVLSFFDKCFQVIVEVPEPVVSGWIAFSQNTIHDGLSGWPVAERNVVAEVFVRFESQLYRSPTPRQILGFVNKVGVLGLRWGGVMDAEALALYALLRKDKSEKKFRKNLLGSSFLGDYTPRMDSADLTRQLAGILFGVCKEKGMEILLQPEIRSTFEEQDPGQLRYLVDHHGEAFWSVWEVSYRSLFTHEQTQKSLCEFTSVFCHALAPYKDRIYANLEYLETIWTTSYETWDLEENDYSVVFEDLLVICNEPERLLEFIKKGVRHWLLKLMSVSSFNDALNSIENVKYLVDLLDKNLSAASVVYFSGGHEKWTSWLIFQNENNIKLSNVIPRHDVISDLVGQLDVNNPSESVLGYLRNTLLIDSSSKTWKSAVDKVHDWFVSPNRQVNNEQAYGLLFDLYCESERLIFTDERLSSEFLRDKFSSAALLQKFQQEQVDKIPSLVALTTLIFDRELTVSKLPDSFKFYWSSEQNKNNVRNVVEVLRSKNKVDVLWLLATNQKNNLAIDAIRSGELDGNLFESIDAIYFIDEFAWATPEDLQSVIKKLLENGVVEKAMDEFLDDPVPYVECIYLLYLHGNEKVKSIVADFLSKLKFDQWMKILSSSVKLLECLPERGDHHLKDALTSILKSPSVPSHFWINVELILEKSIDAVEVAQQFIKSYFDLEKDSLNDDEFKIFSQIVEPYLPIISKNSLRVRIEDWVAKRSLSRIRWILSTGFKPEDVAVSESFIMRIKETYTELAKVGGDDSKLISELATRFNIPLS